MADRDLITYYKLRAPEYDRLYERPDRQDDIGALAALLRPVVAGRRVLELATGTGYWTPILAEAAESVVATDINPETLDIAKARDYPGRNVEFRVADAYMPESVPGRFNSVVAAYFLSHVPRDRVAAWLQSVADRLGSGGRVVLIDNLYVDDSNLPISRTDIDGNTYQDRRLDDGRHFEVLKNFYDGEALEDLARPHAVGIDIELLTYYWFLSFEVR